MAIQVWSLAFEATPAGTDQVSEGDDRIRDLKDTIREELRTEHDCGDSTADANYTDTGRHKTGSARAFFDLGSAAAPSTLMDHSNAGAWPPTTSDNDKLASTDLDNGRLWVDWDDCQPFVREQEITGAAWTDINTNHGDGAGGAPAPAAANWLSLWPRNTAYMGTATDDLQTTAANTRTPITGCTVTVVTPNDGRVYQIVTEVTIPYACTNQEEMAFWLVDDIDGDLDQGLIQAPNAANSSMLGSITLRHVKTPAVAGTTYVYTVDFACSAATSHVNPDITSPIYTGQGGSVAVDFATVETFARIVVELRPDYRVATYTQV